jgi:small subunit ribosomal protein S18
LSEVSESAQESAPAAPYQPSEAREPSGERGERREGREERPRRRGGGRFGRRRVCSFCVDKVDSIDYKEPAKLRRYVSDRGKIEPRRKTGTCAKHQRMLTLALKRARHVALLHAEIADPAKGGALKILVSNFTE